MRRFTRFMRGVSVSAVLLLGGVPALGEPPAGTAPAADLYTSQELLDLVGPVALYPDPVLSSMCAASVYPDQLAAAQQYVTGLAGKEPDEQALTQWDPSVAAMVRLPDVLQMMVGTPDWTAQLAWATANQQADVLAAVQEFRKQVQEAGNLASNEQVKVETQAVPAPEGGTTEVIVIQPTNPEVVYVPSYSPTYVTQPYAYPPGTAAVGLLSWGVGLTMGAVWADNHNDFNWGGGGSINVNNSVNINSANVNRANVNNVDARGRTGGGNTWQAPANRAAQKPATRPTSARAPQGVRPSQRPQPPAGARPGATGPGTSRPGSPSTRPAGAGAGAGGNRPQARPPASKPPAISPGGDRGNLGGAQTRDLSNRGGQSLNRPSAPSARPPAAKPPARANPPAATPRPASGQAGGAGGGMAGGANRSAASTRGASSRGGRSMGGGGGGGGGGRGGGGGGRRR